MAKKYLNRKKQFALGRLKSGQLNRTEEAYRNHLEMMKKAGHILWYSFEGMKFKLGKACFYTPDFMVLTRDHILQAHEVKGFWEDDARVKIKAAADKYPVEFMGVQWKKNEWIYEIF